jgi:hypothetical protein
MTVLTLNAESLHMMLVAEGHGLVGALALPRDPGRALQAIQRDSHSDNDQPRQHQARASQSIGAAFEYLRHESYPCLIVRSGRAVVLAVTWVVFKNNSWANFG